MQGHNWNRKSIPGKTGMIFICQENTVCLCEGSVEGVPTQHETVHRGQAFNLMAVAVSICCTSLLYLVHPEGRTLEPNKYPKSTKRVPGGKAKGKRIPTSGRYPNWGYPRWWHVKTHSLLSLLMTQKKRFVFLAPSLTVPRDLLMQ